MTTGRLSRLGAGACAAHEACYLYAYPDPGTGGEPWTIGIGHTRAAGLPAVKRGDKITLARAFEIYAADMAAVEKDVRATIRVPLAQHRFDALCSFHLNTGAVRSGSVDDKLNRGDEAGALATWSQYTRAGGRIMAGLVTRRREEVELWRTGRYPARKIVLRDTPGGQGRLLDPMSIPWRDAGGQAPVIDIDRPLPPVVLSPVPDVPRPRDAWSAVWQFLKGLFS
jgi:GH24 family phage-related lysozyme (muramidase)